RTVGATGHTNRLRQFPDHRLETLRSAPRAENAAISVGVPGNPFRFQTELKLIEGRAETEPKIVAESRFVSASYFATLRIPLLSGELCRETDGPPTIVVNRSFADTYFGSSSAIGHHLKAEHLGYKDDAAIVGISADARESGLDRAPVPTVYWCAPLAEPGSYFLVRTRNAPMSMAETIRLRINQIEPARSLFDVAPLHQHFSDALAENRLRTVLLSFFATTAIALAAIGLYGTLSYSIGVRRREVGLRLALGAERRQIFKQFLAKALAVCLIGCAAGSALAAAGSRLIANMLYGVSPSDALTFSSVFFAVLFVAALASFLPAFRASRLDPMQVLRYE